MSPYPYFPLPMDFGHGVLYSTNQPLLPHSVRSLAPKALWSLRLNGWRAHGQNTFKCKCKFQHSILRFHRCSMVSDTQRIAIAHQLQCAVFLIAVHVVMMSTCLAFISRPMIYNCTFIRWKRAPAPTIRHVAVFVEIKNTSVSCKHHDGS